MVYVLWGISIHAPRTGSDFNQPIYEQFLSISIHAPRTGSDSLYADVVPTEDISIHAPRTGSDKRKKGGTVSSSQFQSTLPARGATGGIVSKEWSKDISIHAPRTGSDKQEPDFNLDIPDFNPRSPHGERRDYANDIVFQIIFQSTLPARGATGGGVLLVSLEIFQSTLPARGATSWKN